MLHLTEHIEDKTHIIWDWNGTLLNDLEACLATTQAILEEQGLPRITVERYHEIFRFPVKDYYADLGFDLNEFETLSVKFMSGYASRLPSCELHTGARELLVTLQDAGKKQAVLSAAKESELVELLERYGIRHFFDHVYGLSNIYAAGKVERGKQLMEKWEIDPKQAVLIGDTDHDWEVGQALGVEVILLDEGHHSYERLKQRHPKTVSRRPKLPDVP